jgi:hypothetical protein
MKIIKIILISFLLFGGLANVALALNSKTCHTLEIKLPGVGVDGKVCGVGDYLSGIYKLSLGIGVFLAAVVIVMAGIKYATSGDNGGKQKEAREDITQAIFGLLILFGSVIILNVVNPELSNLSNWTLDGIDVNDKENKSYEKEAESLQLVYNICTQKAGEKFAKYYETKNLLVEKECRAEKIALDKCLKGLGCDAVSHEDSGIQLIKDGKPIDHQW